MLYEIEKITKINRIEKTKLLSELNKVTTSLKFKRKNMISDYRDDNYADLQYLEYLLGELDDYYKPILVQRLFNNNYKILLILRYL